MESIEDEQRFSVKQIAKKTKYSEKQIREFIAVGALKVFQPMKNARISISQAQLNDFYYRSPNHGATNVENFAA